VDLRSSHGVLVQEKEGESEVSFENKRYLDALIDRYAGGSHFVHNLIIIRSGRQPFGFSECVFVGTTWSSWYILLALTKCLILKVSRHGFPVNHSCDFVS
jgi:hypothetical protein